MAKILIADKDSNVIKQIKDSLRRFGHGFVSTQDGKIARQHLKRGIFDLAILDYFLPGLKGNELLHEQKSLRVEDRVPIVVTATQHGATVMKEVKEGGAIDFISKPFNARELVEKVTAVLQQERQGLPLLAAAQGFTRS